ncbi:MAG: oadA [Alphaproteobacteria bacterium]|nr:oadA [Alphaproteobacteria bacterium]
MMKCIKACLKKILFLLALQALSGSIAGISEALDFVDREHPHGPALREATKIPVGFIDHMVHYIIASTGTPLRYIPFKIAQEREELGLSLEVPLDQQEMLFQRFFWKPYKLTLEKSPVPGNVIKVPIQEGQQVQRGDILIIVEAMKMEFVIKAASPGEVRDIFCKVGDSKGAGEQLLSFTTPSSRWEAIDPTQIEDLLMSIFPWAIKSLPHEIHDFLGSMATQAKEPAFATTLSPILSASPLPGLPNPPASPSDMTQINEGGKTRKSPSPTGQGFTEKGIAPHSGTRNHDTRTEAPLLKKAKLEGAKDFSQTEPPLNVLMPVFKNKNVNLDDHRASFSPSFGGTWTGGLMLLGGFIFALKAIGYGNLTRVFFRKLTGAFSRPLLNIAYLTMDDFKIRNFTNPSAHNMNRPPFTKRQAG